MLLLCVHVGFLLGRALLDEASCLGVEEGVGGGRAQWPTGSYETTDVVIGRETVLARGSLRSSSPVDRRGGGHCDR